MNLMMTCTIIAGAVVACGDAAESGGSTLGDAGAASSAAGAGGAGGVGGAGGSGATGGTPEPVCAFQVPARGGIACAIEPASTDARITNGFGYHAVGVPARVTPATQVYVHLVGSHGDPAKPDTQSFPNQLLLDELTSLGLLVIMPAYDNEPTVGSLCKQDLDCYEAVRREVLYGQDAPAPYSDLKSVQKPNDVVSRLGALVTAITGSGLLGATPPSALAGGEVDVAKLRLGGHSQGGGYAALFAKDSGVARLCMLSSPADGGVGQPAPWTAGTWMTELDRRRGVVHEEDMGFLKIEANFASMGLVEGTNWVRLTLATADAHAATVKDPAVATARAGCIHDD